MSIFDLTMRSTVRISAPLQSAWEVFADVSRWTEWSEVTLRSDVDEGFGWREGEALRLRLRMAGVGVPFNVRITESDFPLSPSMSKTLDISEGEGRGEGDAGPRGPATAYPPPPRRRRLTIYRRGRDGERVNAGTQVPATAVPRRIAWASTKLTVTAVRTFTFEDDASFEDESGATLVTDEKVFTSPVLPVRLFYPRPLIRRMTESFLADLKAECEHTT